MTGREAEHLRMPSVQGPKRALPVPVLALLAAASIGNPMAQLMVRNLTEDLVWPT
jgi:hypothetical protein